MENIIVTRSLKMQLNQDILHEQVENGTTINKNLMQIKQINNLKHLKKFFEYKKNNQDKKIHVSHRTPQAALIIPREVQIGEA